MLVNIDKLIEIYPFFKKKTVYNWTSQGIIPHHKPRRKLLLFETKEIDEFVNSNPVSTADEIRSKVITDIVTKKKP